MGAKAEKTRAAIRQAAYALFAAKGFKEVTMTDICAATGLSRGGLYRYYAGTGEIFAEILSQEVTVTERMEQKESAAVILEDLLAAIHQEILEKERSLSLAIYEYASLGNQPLFVRINERAKARWMGLIHYGVATGAFRPVDAEQTAELILYYYQGLRMWSRVIPLDSRAADHYTHAIRQLLYAAPPQDPPTDTAES